MREESRLVQKQVDSTQPNSNHFRSEDPPVRRPSCFHLRQTMVSSPPAQPSTGMPTTSATSPPAPAASHPHPFAYHATSAPSASSAVLALPALGSPLYNALFRKPNPKARSKQQHHVPSIAMADPRAHTIAVPTGQLQPQLCAAVPQALVMASPEQPPQGVPIAPLPKINLAPSTAPATEQSNPIDRERSGEGSSIVVINDRKVNLLESESGSLYALCRSWVRNGVLHERQPSLGNGEPILPRPLPASVVDSRISEQDNNNAEDGDVDEEPQKNADGEYNTEDLLKQHVKRAKKIRAGLQKERLRRIERYKQRLALLLPPPSELGRHDPPW